jgi:hypothetical protein
MLRRCCLVLAGLLIAGPVFAEPGSGAAPSMPNRSIRLAIDVELARLAAAPSEAAAISRQAPARTRPWVARHPVATAAIAGFLSGFAIGWAAGDDAVFDDFTGEFNGVLLGGIVAGSAASAVAIVRAARK